MVFTPFLLFKSLNHYIYVTRTYNLIINIYKWIINIIQLEMCYWFIYCGETFWWSHYSHNFYYRQLPWLSPLSEVTVNTTQYNCSGMGPNGYGKYHKPQTGFISSLGIFVASIFPDIPSLHLYCHSKVKNWKNPNCALVVTLGSNILPFDYQHPAGNF